jgi:hypothetical protein
MCKKSFLFEQLCIWWRHEDRTMINGIPAVIRATYFGFFCAGWLAFLGLVARRFFPPHDLMVFIGELHRLLLRYYG